MQERCCVISRFPTYISRGGAVDACDRRHLAPQALALSVAGIRSDRSAMRAASIRPGNTKIDPRVQAVVTAARFYGIELSPADFRSVESDAMPSGASLSAWVQESGLWSRAVRLRWRQLMRLQDTGPVVLLFTDASAGLMTSVDPDQEIVMLKDPLAPAGAPAVAVDK